MLNKILSIEQKSELFTAHSSSKIKTTGPSLKWVLDQVLEEGTGLTEEMENDIVAFVTALNGGYQKNEHSLNQSRSSPTNSEFKNPVETMQKILFNICIALSSSLMKEIEGCNAEQKKLSTEQNFLEFTKMCLARSESKGDQLSIDVDQKAIDMNEEDISCWKAKLNLNKPRLQHLRKEAGFHEDSVDVVTGWFRNDAQYFKLTHPVICYKSQGNWGVLELLETLEGVEDTKWKLIDEYLRSKTVVFYDDKQWEIKSMKKDSLDVNGNTRTITLKRKDDNSIVEVIEISADKKLSVAGNEITNPNSSIQFTTLNFFKENFTIKKFFEGSTSCSKSFDGHVIHHPITKEIEYINTTGDTVKGFLLEECEISEKPGKGTFFKHKMTIQYMTYKYLYHPETKKEVKDLEEENEAQNAKISEKKSENRALRKKIEEAEIRLRHEKKDQLSANSQVRQYDVSNPDILADSIQNSIRVIEVSLSKSKKKIQNLSLSFTAVNEVILPFLQETNNLSKGDWISLLNNSVRHYFLTILPAQDNEIQKGVKNMYWALAIGYCQSKQHNSQGTLEQFKEKLRLPSSMNLKETVMPFWDANKLASLELSLGTAIESELPKLIKQIVLDHKADIETKLHTVIDTEKPFSERVTCEAFSLLCDVNIGFFNRDTFEFNYASQTNTVLDKPICIERREAKLYIHAAPNRFLFKETMESHPKKTEEKSAGSHSGFPKLSQQIGTNWYSTLFSSDTRTAIEKEELHRPVWLTEDIEETHVLVMQAPLQITSQKIRSINIPPCDDTVRWLAIPTDGSSDVYASSRKHTPKSSELYSGLALLYLSKTHDSFFTQKRTFTCNDGTMIMMRSEEGVLIFSCK